MKGIRMGHVSRRLGLALYLLDDFTGQQAKYPVSVTANQYQKGIRKSDGYYLLMDDGADKYHIEIKSEVYQNVNMEVEKVRLNPRLPVMTIRLRPSRSYPVPNGTKCLQGQEKPEQTLYFKEETTFARLLNDVLPNQKTELYLYTEESGQLEDTFIYLENQQTGMGEIAQIEACIDKETFKFRLKEPLHHEYTKVSCRVYHVHIVRTDADGMYFYPLRCGKLPERIENENK